MRKPASYPYLLNVRVYEYMSYLRVLTLMITFVSFLVRFLQGEAQMQLISGGINGFPGWLNEHDPWD